MYMRDIKVIDVMEYINLSYIVGAGGMFIYLNVHAGYIVINSILYCNQSCTVDKAVSSYT